MKTKYEIADLDADITVVARVRRDGVGCVLSVANFRSSIRYSMFMVRYNDDGRTTMSMYRMPTHARSMGRYVRDVGRKSLLALMSLFLKGRIRMPMQAMKGSCAG